MDRRRDDLEARWRHKLRPVLRNAAHTIAPRIAVLMQRKESAQSDRAAIDQALQTLKELGLWSEWQAIVKSGLIEAYAEGEVAALAYLAAAVDAPIPDFGMAFPQQLQKLRELGSLPGWSDPTSWMGKQLDGLGYDLGRSLSAAQEAGNTYDEMLAITEAHITGDGSYAYMLLDQAIGSTSTQGSLSLYASEGVERTDILVSADACDECVSLADNNPFDLSEAPDVPVHPRCRCALAPHIEAVAAISGA